MAAHLQVVSSVSNNYSSSRPRSSSSGREYLGIAVEGRQRKFVHRHGHGHAKTSKSANPSRTCDTTASDRSPRRRVAATFAAPAPTPLYPLGLLEQGTWAGSPFLFPPPLPFPSSPAAPIWSRALRWAAPPAPLKLRHTPSQAPPPLFRPRWPEPSPAWSTAPWTAAPPAPPAPPLSAPSPLPFRLAPLPNPLGAGPPGRQPLQRPLAPRRVELVHVGAQLGHDLGKGGGC